MNAKHGRNCESLRYAVKQLENTLGKMYSGTYSSDGNDEFFSRAVFGKIDEQLKGVKISAMRAVS